MNENANEKLIKRKRKVAIISFIIFLAVMGFLSYFLIIKFSQIAATGMEFREYVRSFGNWRFLIAFLLQIIQVFIAIIPGEAVEIGVGYAFGWLGGTAICLLGVAVGSAMIFLLTKKFGIKLIELFVSTDKINEMKFINTNEKMRRFTFLVFFIPGTPKDLLTYFVGLTRMTLSEFLAITMLARIPSVVSSTIGGGYIAEEKYVEAVILFVVTGLISLIGLKLYTMLIKKMKSKSEISEEADETDKNEISETIK